MAEVCWQPTWSTGNGSNSFGWRFIDGPRVRLCRSLPLCYFAVSYTCAAWPVLCKSEHVLPRVRLIMGLGFLAGEFRKKEAAQALEDQISNVRMHLRAMGMDRGKGGDALWVRRALCG